MPEDPSMQPEFQEWQEWLEGLDLDLPVSDLIDDPAWLENLTFSPEELAYLEELGLDYAQELFGRDVIPDMPEMDMPEPLLEPDHSPELEPDHDVDLDR